MSGDATPDWSVSIVDFDAAVDPTTLDAHELNARRHPQYQRDALRTALSKVGWVDAVKVNSRTGKIVDGHARVEEALEAGVTVPVLWVDLDEEQERYVLATLDPIGALAVYDSEVLGGLLEDLTIESAEIQAMLELHGLESSRESWAVGDGDADKDAAGGDALPDPSEFWPAVTVKVEPHVLTEWNKVSGVWDGTDSSLLGELLDAWQRHR